MARSATIRVRREPGGYKDRLRRYRVVVDGEERAKLGRGESVDIPVPAGKHTVRVKIAWTGSPEWGVDLRGGEVGSFVCAPAPGLSLNFANSEGWVELHPED